MSFKERLFHQLVTLFETRIKDRRFNFQELCLLLGRLVCNHDIPLNYTDSIVLVGLNGLKILMLICRHTVRIIKRITSHRYQSRTCLLKHCHLLKLRF